MAFTVQIKGLEQELNKIKNLPTRLKADVGLEVRDSANQWVLKSSMDAPKDVGFLAQSIRSEQKETLKYSVIVDSEYAAPMEFGTKGKYRPIPGTEAYVAQFKGKPTGTWKEFIRNIINWVRRKGISGSYSIKTRKRVGKKFDKLAEDWTVAYLIARSILKYGVSPHPYLFKHQETIVSGMIAGIKQKLDSYD